MFTLDVPPFVPHPLLRNGHAQTVLASVYTGISKIPRSVERRVKLADGDQLVLHASPPSGATAANRQVLLLHGLGGCHASAYMIRTTVRLVEIGVPCWRLDARGCGAGVPLAKFHHHAGRIEDLQMAIELILESRPNAPVTIVGYSLGANQLLNWLADKCSRGCPQVDSAIAIAPPIDLARCSQNLQKGLNRGYDAYFASLLRRRLIERRRCVPNLADRSVKPLPRSLYEFDDQFTAPLGGFSSAQEYYRRCSAAPKLTQISTPTLIVADEHDPVVPFDIFRSLPKSSQIRILNTRFGGHLGYLSNSSDDGNRRWLDWRIRDWIANLTHRAMD